VQSDGQTPDSENAQWLRDHVRKRLQALSEHLHAKRQSSPHGAEAGITKPEEDDSGSPSKTAAGDHGPVATEGSRSQPRVLVLQRELLPDLPLVASIARAGLEVVGPFNKVSEAFDWIANDRPDAAVLDIALWDGVSFDLAGELHRRKIPFLFYTSWDDTELIPIELREMPFLEKPIHLVLVARLLSKMIKRGQVLEGQEEDDSHWSSISDPPPASG
jgi:hypothetical protein